MDVIALAALKKANQGGGSADAVLYTEQSLIDAQKAQARTNINAQAQHDTAILMIATTDWTAATSGFTCTKTVDGMTDTALVFITFSDTEGDYGYSQSENALTFSIDAVPSASVTVNVGWLV